MIFCDKYIERLIEELPDMVKTKDLVKAGIFLSEQVAVNARRRGDGPDFFRLNAKTVLYPKEGVIAWLKSKRGDASST